MGRKSRAKRVKKRDQEAQVASTRAKLRVLRRAIWKFVLPLLLLTSSAAFVAIGYHYLRTTVPISFSANLVSNGNVQFTYTTYQQETYSPACGCWADKSERWRGITFAAKRIEVTNRTESKQTAFWLMAAEPNRLDWTPTVFRPSVRIIRMAVVSEKELQLTDILSGSQSNSVHLLEDVTLPHEDAFALVTSQPVTIHLPGTHPIAAYIPVENSQVSITQQTSTFPLSPGGPKIQEEYPASTAFFTKTGEFHGGDSLAYPMLDLVGSQTVLLTEDSSAVLMSPTQEKALNATSLPNRRAMTAILVNSPFSTRVSAVPFGDLVPIANNPVSQRAPEHSQFRKPDEPGRPLKPDERVVTIGASEVCLPTKPLLRRRGVLDVNISESLSAEEYSHLEESLRRSDTVTAFNIRSRAPELDHHGMDFRYPAIPKIGGFNVFGLLSELTLGVTSGQIMVGAASIPIEAPSRIKFKSIRAFTPKRNVVPIPIVVNGTEQLDFSLEATSQMYINDAPVKLEADRKRALIEYAVWILAFVQTAAAIIAIWPRRGRMAGREDQPGPKKGNN